MEYSIIKKDDKSDSEWYHNLGTSIWYLIFIIIIPIIIKFTISFTALRYYFPILDLIANVFSSSGQQELHIFKDLYSLTPNNVISFLSTNFINLLALVGVSWNGILYAIKTSNIWAGIAVSAVMYVITYLLPTQIIPYFIQKVQKKIDNWLSIDYKDKKRFKWEAYISGGLFVVFLILLEGFVIKWYINSLK